jgi:hypothetical protein
MGLPVTHEQNLYLRHGFNYCLKEYASLANTPKEHEAHTKPLIAVGRAKRGYAAAPRHEKTPLHENFEFIVHCLPITAFRNNHHDFSLNFASFR